MIAFILNTPYTLFGIIFALLAGPTSVKWNWRPYAFVITIRKFWWAFGYMKGMRGMAIGHVVLLGPNLELNDLEHELIHVEQAQREPLIHPVLYLIELLRKGYRGNKYETEAYRRAGNTYKER